MDASDEYVYAVYHTAMRVGCRTHDPGVLGGVMLWPYAKSPSEGQRAVFRSTGPLPSRQASASLCGALASFWSVIANPVVGRRASWAGRVREPSTGASAKLSGSYRFLSIGMSYKVPVVLGALSLQSARDVSYKVPVDNSRIPPTYPRSGALEEGLGACCGAASPRDRPGPLWRLGRTAGPA